MRTRLTLLAAVVALAVAGSALAQPEPTAGCPASDNYGSDSTRGRFATVNGIRLYYEIHGDTGDPLLLLHGNGGSIARTGCQLHYFSTFRRVIAVDTRGHGKSEAGTDRFTYELMADDFAALLDHLGMPTADVMGHSDGGILGLVLAIRHPSKVRRLVSSSPNLRPDETAVLPFFIDGVKRQLVEVSRMIETNDTTRDWHVRKRQLDLMLEEPHISTASLKRITAPTLIISGDEDIMPLSHMIEIYSNIPQAQLLIVPGTTHGHPRARYELFNEMAKQFLTQPFVRPRNGR